MNSSYRSGEVSLTHNLREDLKDLCEGVSGERIYPVLEENTWRHCWPLVEGFAGIPEGNILVLRAGEEYKNLDQLTAVWDHLGRAGADRSSLVINIGGGMLTDLAGFAACTFKRGVEFINVPTTLLAMVDASTGGKTGINFRGLKNEIGVIRQPRNVLIWPRFLRTLGREELLSGFAEMLKAGLIADRSLWDDLKEYDITELDEASLGQLIWRSVMIKKSYTDTDPDEKGPRKALNFGHTVGHAIESEMLRQGNPVPHGYAVAWGMIDEAGLSNKMLGLSGESLEEITHTLTRLYGNAPEEVRDRNLLEAWMRSDKKNRDGIIQYTLLEEIGKCRIDCALMR